MHIINPPDISSMELLKNIQGNILKGHGRDHTTHIFFSFKKAKTNQAKTWIRKIAKEQITTMHRQLWERELYKRNRIPGGLFSCFFLSASGYQHLGFDNIKRKFKDKAFIKGMQHRVNENRDPDVKHWEEGYHNATDAMLLLADDEQERLTVMTTAMLSELEKFADVHIVEYGHVIRNRNGDGIEHFGYADGISQPLFLRDDINEYVKNNTANGAQLVFDPEADPQLVLLSDPYAPAAAKDTAYGSYFVFRKLEQDVRGFKKREEEIGEKLFPGNDREDEREIVGGYLVGRFEDGTPVTLAAEEGMIGAGNFNNFNYNHDQNGARCPFFAHIRKVTPRSSGRVGQDEKQRRFARRGIPYGQREVPPDSDPHFLQMPTGGVGLLFMCYQHSIEDQFEFVQQNWVNNPHFPSGKPSNVDPIIGPEVASGDPGLFSLPEKYGFPSPTKAFGFDNFVHMKGGEYFFAPSIIFLQSLK